MKVVSPIMRKQSCKLFSLCKLFELVDLKKTISIEMVFL